MEESKVDRPKGTLESIGKSQSAVGNLIGQQNQKTRKAALSVNTPFNYKLKDDRIIKDKNLQKNNQPVILQFIVALLKKMEV